MGVAFRYMAYDATGKPDPSASATLSSASSSSSSNSGDVEIFGGLNVKNTIDFVNDRWKELRDRLAAARAGTTMSSSSVGGSSPSTSTVTLSTKAAANTTVVAVAPEYTTETCIETRGSRGSWCQVKSLVYFCLYTETLWWLQLNYHQYKQHCQSSSQRQQGKNLHSTSSSLPANTLIFNINSASSYSGVTAGDDEQTMSSFLSSLSSWMILPQWKFGWDEMLVYGRRVISRLKSAAYDYQVTMTLVGFFDALFALALPKNVVIKLTQQPFHRAVVVSSSLLNSSSGRRSGSSGRAATTTKQHLSMSDRCAVGIDSVYTCLWANAAFFLSSYAYGQYVLWRIHQQQVTRRNDRSHGQQAYIFHQKSYLLLYETTLRYMASAIGAGLGSFIWPGYGTILGIGFGDGIAHLQASDPIIPMDRLTKMVVKLSSIIKIPIQAGREIITTTFGIVVNSKSSNVESDSTIVLEEDLMCGCCQIAAFSSDPSDQNRAPISSRECSHTICKKCVQQVHLNLVERVHIYTEWIPCPICKAPNAFSSHNHLFNRSLCSAIGLVERKRLRIKHLEAQNQKLRFQYQSEQQQKAFEGHSTQIKMVRSLSPTSVSSRISRQTIR